MLATLRCSRAAASRTAFLIAGSMRRFSVEIFVRAMRHNITQKTTKCNALCIFPNLRAERYDVSQSREEEADMEQVIFAICMFFGVVSVALIAFTLLWIALGKLSV